MVRPKPPGRSHDPASDDGARGMVVTPCGRERSGSCGRQNSAYGFAAAFNNFTMSFLEDKMVRFRNAKKGFAV